MYEIICCIFLGFFVIIGISNITYFLIKSFFKFDNFNQKNLTAENAEYIIRSSKYHDLNHKICVKNKNNKELNFIQNKLDIT